MGSVPDRDSLYQYEALIVVSYSSGLELSVKTSVWSKASDISKYDILDYIIDQKWLDFPDDSGGEKFQAQKINLESNEILGIVCKNARLVSMPSKSQEPVADVDGDPDEKECHHCFGVTFKLKRKMFVFRYTIRIIAAENNLSYSSAQDFLDSVKEISDVKGKRITFEKHRPIVTSIKKKSELDKKLMTT